MLTCRRDDKAFEKERPGCKTGKRLNQLLIRFSWEREGISNGSFLKKMLKEEGEEKICLSLLTTGKFFIFEGICIIQEEKSPHPPPALLGSMVEGKSAGVRLVTEREGKRVDEPPDMSAPAPDIRVFLPRFRYLSDHILG